MLKLKTVLLTIVLSLSFVTTGCSVVEKVADTAKSLTPTQAVIATMAIKAGTVDLILREAGKSTAVAKVIVNIVTEATNYISGGGVTVISELDAKLAERIAKLNLSPQKQIIVDTLIALVKARLEVEVTGNVLNADTVVIISKVLSIIKVTAEDYE